MTEPERAALDHIRQVVDSVIGATPPPEPVQPGVKPVILPVPYLSQLGDEANLPSNDSGAAAGVMLISAYKDQTITTADFHNQTGEGDESGLSFTQIMNILGVNGVPVELRSNLKLADLSLILFSGRPVIVPIQQSILKQAGLTPDTFNGPYYVVVVGMDVKHVFIHDPLRQDASGEAQGISWLTFYQAWSQAPGYVRAVLVPRQQLLRRVRVTSNQLDVYDQPMSNSGPVGSVNLGELFEVTAQKNGWGKIGEDRWINLSNTTDI
jgi:hypothetical protein